MQAKLLYNMDAINTQMYSNSGLDIETITPDELVGSLNDIEKKFAPKLLYLSGDKSLMKYRDWAN